jgi:ammonia channel protein AmtB
MVDQQTRAEYERVTGEAQALLARLGAEPQVGSGGEESVAGPPAAGTVTVTASPALPLAVIAGLALAAGAAAMLIGNSTAEIVFAVGAVVLALLAAVLAVLAYAKANAIPTEDIVDVITSLHGLVGKLMAGAESESRETERDVLSARPD